MAVLAATIIPQFSTSTKDAKMSNLKFNLRTCGRSWRCTRSSTRASIRRPPQIPTSRSQLTQKTDQNTTLDPTNGACGPYIEGDIPINPFNNSTRGNSSGQHGADRPDRQYRRLAVQSAARLVLSEQHRILSEHGQFRQSELSDRFRSLPDGAFCVRGLLPCRVVRGGPSLFALVTCYKSPCWKSSEEIGYSIGNLVRALSESQSCTYFWLELLHHYPVV